MSDAIREAFEKWAKAEEPSVNLSTFINGAYIYAEAHMAFRAWQAALQSGEPVYAFRRKGFDDFCTCTEERYLELKEKPNTFEVSIFYTTPRPVVDANEIWAAAQLLPDEGIEDGVARIEAMLSAGKGGE